MYVSNRICQYLPSSCLAYLLQLQGMPDCVGPGGVTPPGGQVLFGVALDDGRVDEGVGVGVEKDMSS